MIARLIAILILAGCLREHPALASDPDDDPSHILINLSVKFIKHGADGPNPTQSDLTNLIARSNRMLDAQMRGFRLHIAESIIIDPEQAGAPLNPITLYLTNSPPGGARIPKQVSLVDYYQWWQTTNATLPSFGDDDGRAVIYYSNGDISDNSTESLWTAMCNMFFAAVRSNREAFCYRTNMANLFVVWPGYAGGQGFFPSGDHDNNNIFFVSSIDDVALFLHEFGHYSNLHHPFASVESIQKDALGTEVPDLADTPPDAWDINTASIPEDSFASYTNAIRWNQLSAAMFHTTNYAGLGDDQRLYVRQMAFISHLTYSNEVLTADHRLPQLDTSAVTTMMKIWENIVSYHKGQDPDERNWIYSEMQLDIMSDTFRSVRNKITTGKTQFIGGNRPDVSTAVGSSQNSFTNVADAVAAAASGGGDILILRPGNYNETMTIAKPLTLRATRDGSVSLGKP
jgi:hypothetical protein